MKASQIVLSVCGAAAVAVAAAAPAPTAQARAAHAPAAPAPAGRDGMRAACGPARPGYARCLSLYAPQTAVNAALAARAAGKRVPAAATTPQGWGATGIDAAYQLPATRNPHATVAIVDAMSTPHLAADLTVYRKQYKLPACTTASGCLRIVNQQGKTSPLPRADRYGWGVEETLDVSMVSAACPRCKLLVVEARSATLANLAAAEDTAARLGAVAVSNSYGAAESGFTQVSARAYDHPGHAVVAASGDSGFTQASFPANLATVTAAGGTELARAVNARGWTEKAWFASGSGCSAYVAKPAWQHDPHCPGRTVADVSAVAWDLAMYDSSLGTYGPWFEVGGTSAAAPLIAGVYALAGNATTVKPGYEYAHASGLFDITQGNNDTQTGTGAACGHDYLCQATKGYDAPTGLGTPNGTAAF
jgi:subtilase family serine protease